MIILRPTDIEDEVRKALADYMTVYVRPLPAKFTTPCILVTATGGSSTNEIDSFNVTLDARATTDEESYSLIRTAQGILEAQGSNQFGAIRNVSINSLSRWGSDPVRPDLKLSTLTVVVTAHREEIAINES